MAEECKKIECDYANQGYLDPWPPVRGEYRLGDPRAGVAVVTLASVFNPRGTAISGPARLRTWDIVANVISNSNIRFHRCGGVEGPSARKYSLALHKNGIDEKGRIIGSKERYSSFRTSPFRPSSVFSGRWSDRQDWPEDMKEIELVSNTITSQCLFQRSPTR